MGQERPQCGRYCATASLQKQGSKRMCRNSQDSTSCEGPGSLTDLVSLVQSLLPILWPSAMFLGFRIHSQS